MAKSKILPKHLYWQREPKIRQQGTTSKQWTFCEVRDMMNRIFEFYVHCTRVCDKKFVQNHFIKDRIKYHFEQIQFLREYASVHICLVHFIIIHLVCLLKCGKVQNRDMVDFMYRRRLSNQIF
jgi:hypothetical protein